MEHLIRAEIHYCWTLIGLYLQILPDCISCKISCDLKTKCVMWFLSLRNVLMAIGWGLSGATMQTSLTCNIWLLSIYESRLRGKRMQDWSNSTQNHLLILPRLHNLTFNKLNSDTHFTVLNSAHCQLLVILSFWFPISYVKWLKSKFH